MTSARKQFANRANARRSTGPKTVEGKARVSRNALRHGFARQSWAEGALRDVAWTGAVDALARLIAGEHANAAHLARALVVAAAQHDLLLVRRARRELEATASRGRTVRNQALLASLERLDRYERRALTRRRRAVAALDAAVRDSPAGDFAEQSQPVKSQ